MINKLINELINICLCYLGAFYTTKTSHGIRIMALNTNMYYFSDKITNPANYSDPAGQFAWMENTLTAARTAKEKVSCYLFIYL